MKRMPPAFESCTRFFSMNGQLPAPVTCSSVFAWPRNSLPRSTPQPPSLTSTPAACPSRNKFPSTRGHAAAAICSPALALPKTSLPRTVASFRAASSVAIAVAAAAAAAGRSAIVAGLRCAAAACAGVAPGAVTTRLPSLSSVAVTSAPDSKLLLETAVASSATSSAAAQAAPPTAVPVVASSDVVVVVAASGGGGGCVATGGVLGGGISQTRPETNTPTSAPLHTVLRSMVGALPSTLMPAPAHPRTELWRTCDVRKRSAERLSACSDRRYPCGLWAPR